jgi:hypothetical protein
MDLYSGTHGFMIRSVATDSESWTCNFSLVNKSGSHSPGDIVVRKDGSARVSSSCRSWSSLNSCGASGSFVTTHIASEEVEDIRSSSMGDGTSLDAPSVGFGPLGCCPGR